MCGIFGIYGHPEAANIAYLGLHGLQHRGQESAGIVTTAADGEHMVVHRSMGLVQAGFSNADLDRLRGSIGVGHVRYSTSGSSHIRNAQPFAFDYHGGSVAVAHNGNLTNHEPLRQRLEARGSIFQTNADTEAIVHLLAISEKATLAERVVELDNQMNEVQARGMVQATPYWRDKRYLYLVHQQHDGARNREYIGKDEHKQAAALQRVENWHQYQRLDQNHKRAQGNLDYWIRELRLSLSRIGGG